MTRLAVLAILSLAARNVVALGSAAPAEGPLEEGRALLAAGSYPEAAAAFHEALRLQGLSSFTIRVAVYCDVSNLERQLRSSGSSPDLILLRRPVKDQYCWGLYWGLFPTRAQAQAALVQIPAALRGPGQAPAPIAAGVLVPMEPASMRPLPRTAPAPEPPPLARSRVGDAPPPVPAPEPVAVEPTPSRGLPPLPASATAADPMPELQEPPLPASPIRTHRFPRVEISASYAYLWVDQLPLVIPLTDKLVYTADLSGSLKVGWLASVNINVTERIGIVTEVSGHRRSETLFISDNLAIDRSRSMLALHAGVRYTDRADSLATPYAQALWGFTHTSVSGDSQTKFSVQPGIGVMFRVSDCFKVGVGADYRRVFRDADDRNDFRFHAGIVFCVCDNK